MHTHPGWAHPSRMGPPIPDGAVPVAATIQPTFPYRPTARISSLGFTSCDRL